jgi:hypothetical protein
VKEVLAMRFRCQWGRDRGRKRTRGQLNSKFLPFNFLCSLRALLVLPLLGPQTLFLSHHPSCLLPYPLSSTSSSRDSEKIVTDCLSRDGLVGRDVDARIEGDEIEEEVREVISRARWSVTHQHVSVLLSRSGNPGY